MDEDDDYERQRQETIRQNKELLASLGLNASTTRIGSPPPEPKPKPRRTASSSSTIKRRRGSLSPSPGPSGSAPEPRQRSARVAARGDRRVYNEKDLSASDIHRQSQRERRGPREGIRKSGRLSGNGPSDPRYLEPDTTDEEDSDYYRSPRQKVRIENIPSKVRRGRGVDESSPEEDENGRPRRRVRMPEPTRAEDGSGELIFEEEWSHFRPNLRPDEVLRGGAFGGTYFKEHYSTVLNADLDVAAELAEFPPSWTQGYDLERYLTSPVYDPSINRYKKKAGQSLADWEKAGWIIRKDPRGWFQWYIRFYLGRRSRDDARQVSRWQKAVGITGRFRRAADKSVASRQICWQWAVDCGYAPPTPEPETQAAKEEA